MQVLSVSSVPMKSEVAGLKVMWTAMKKQITKIHLLHTNEDKILPAIRI